MPEEKKKAGSIRQYATLGKPKALDAETPKPPDTQELEHPKVQTSEHQDAQELERSNVTASKLLNVQTSESPSAQERKRHTIYLTPTLSKWLKVYAASTEQEISEIAEKAIQRFREGTER